MITIKNLFSYPLDMELFNGWNDPPFKQIWSGFYESINKAINPFFLQKLDSVFQQVNYHLLDK